MASQHTCGHTAGGAQYAPFKVVAVSSSFCMHAGARCTGTSILSRQQAGQSQVLRCQEAHTRAQYRAHTVYLHSSAEPLPAQGIAASAAVGRSTVCSSRAHALGSTTTTTTTIPVVSSGVGLMHRVHSAQGLHQWLRRHATIVVPVRASTSPLLLHVHESAKCGW